MAAWISVYCENSVGSVTPQELLEAISAADFWNLAEWYKAPEEKVPSALVSFRIEPTREDGFDV